MQQRTFALNKFVYKLISTISSVAHDFHPTLDGPTSAHAKHVHMQFGSYVALLARPCTFYFFCAAGCFTLTLWRSSRNNDDDDDVVCFDIKPFFCGARKQAQAAHYKR